MKKLGQGCSRCEQWCLCLGHLPCLHLAGDLAVLWWGEKVVKTACQVQARVGGSLPGVRWLKSLVAARCLNSPAHLWLFFHSSRARAWRCLRVVKYSRIHRLQWPSPNSEYFSLPECTAFMTGPRNPVFKEWACLLPAVWYQWWMELCFHTLLLFEVLEAWSRREGFSFLMCRASPSQPGRQPSH